MCEDNTPENAGKSNGDTPSAPWVRLDLFSGRDDIRYPGFTKREVIAKDIMAGLVSNTELHQSWSGYAIGAVSAADALLAELAKPQGL